MCLLTSVMLCACSCKCRFFFKWYGVHRCRHVLTHSFPSRRSSDLFDHAAAVTNFVVAPLSLLSGTFYSIESLAPTFQAVSHANPFFRSDEHTSELPSLMRISYAGFCLKKTKHNFTKFSSAYLHNILKTSTWT